jgi:uncharacterized protein (TIGR03435 family)
MRAFLLCFVALSCLAQTTFDVVSIKPNLSGAEGGSIRLTPGGRLVAQNASLRQLITTAYDVRDFQLFGGPSWMASERFDIEAKAAGNPTQDQISQMLQALLADRFSLTVHREKKEVPIYRLTVAKGGSKLPPAKAECTPMVPPPAKFDPATLRPCGGFNSNVGMMLGGAVSTTKLAASLSRTLGRTVVDETGLSGSFDVSLHWTPDAQPQTANSSDPDFFTAIQEQLGLRLESGRGPVEVLVVDQAERPSQN